MSGAEHIMFIHSEFIHKYYQAPTTTRLALLVWEIHGRTGQTCPLPSWHGWSNTEFLVPDWAEKSPGLLNTDASLPAQSASLRMRPGPQHVLKAPSEAAVQEGGARGLGELPPLNACCLCSETPPALPAEHLPQPRRQDPYHPRPDEETKLLFWGNFPKSESQ